MLYLIYKNASYVSVLKTQQIRYLKCHYLSNQVVVISNPAIMKKNLLLILLPWKSQLIRWQTVTQYISFVHPLLWWAPTFHEPLTISTEVPKYAVKTRVYSEECQVASKNKNWDPSGRIYFTLISIDTGYITPVFFTLLHTPEHSKYESVTDFYNFTMVYSWKVISCLAEPP